VDQAAGNGHGHLAPVHAPVPERPLEEAAVAQPVAAVVRLIAALPGMVAVELAMHAVLVQDPELAVLHGDAVAHAASTASSLFFSSTRASSACLRSDMSRATDTRYSRPS